MPHTFRGLTLVELLVVIAAIGVMLSLLVPAVQSAREAARRSQCTARLSQIGLALHVYHDAYHCFPPGCVEPRGRRIAWSTLLLPYLELSSIWNQFDRGQPFYSAVNLRATATVIPHYLCPSTTRVDSDRGDSRTNDRNGNDLHDPGDFQGVTDYGGLFGTALGAHPWLGNGNGLFVWDVSIGLHQVSDGASQTLAVAEDTGRGRRADGEWSNGENIFDQSGPINALQNNELWSDHPGGVQAVAADRSARFLSTSTDPLVLAALITRGCGD